MQNNYLYFDNAATTKVSDNARNAYIQALDFYYNPSSLYLSGAEVKNQIEICRKTILKKLNARKDSTIIFTSSATESNNWVVRSLVRRKDKKYIFSMGEHPSVYNSAKQLKDEGYNIIFVPLKTDGCVDEKALYSEIDKKTELVSLIHVNNETGAVNDIKAITDKIKSLSPGTLVHSDGVQAIGKIEVNLNDLGVDFYTISGHKINAVKGVGALYIAYINKITPFIYGGGQENGMRSGTENYAAISSLQTAINDATENININKLQKLKNIFLQTLGTVPDYVLASKETNVPNIISVCFKNVRGETIQHMLENDKILVGVGSACNSKHQDYRVQKAMKIPENYYKGTIRISFDQSCSENEIKTVANKIKQNVAGYLLRTKK